MTLMMKKEMTIQEKFQKAFFLYNSKVAIEKNYITLTFKDLEERTKIIATLIKEKRISQKSNIGIFLDEKIEVISVILGILDAGCVFMPLEPSLPLKRIEKMLASTNTTTLFVDKTNYEKLKNLDYFNSINNIIIINEDFYTDNQNLIEKYTPTNISQEDEIYIYFTSGSTGDPKAILGKNKSLLQFINWEIDTFNINPSIRVSQFISIGFDAFLRDMFVPLCSGGTICVPEDFEKIFNSQELIKWIDNNNIHLIHCVPSLFQVFNSKDLTNDNFKNLQYILMSGEKIISYSLKNWYTIFGERIQLVNLYGTTETTMIKTYYLINKEDFNLENIPIGKPISGARIIILDENKKLCSPGTFGEIYIRTPYRTFGYYNDSDLNKEKFIINPFSNDENDLLYKTGDIGRQLADGNYELQGRKDNQIKIRGNRVEISEIENVLLKNPMISNAVITKNTINEEDVICAYYIPAKARKRITQTDKAKEKTKPKKANIINLFNNQVRLQPETILLKSKKDSYDYSFVNNYTNRIANLLLEKYDDRFKLTSAERERYKRQLLLEGWGVDAQEKLKATTVFVGGVGGSAPLLMQLALLGIGTIKICDFDEVELSNLNRQFLHNDSKIGMNKAVSGKMTLDLVNPHVKIIAYTEKVTFDNVFEYVGDADIIIDLIDNMDAKFALSECAVAKGIPHTISSMIDYNSYAAVFYGEENACFHCLYNRDLLDEVKVLGSLQEGYTRQSLSVHCSSMAYSTTFVVNEIIKMILGFEEPKTNKYALISPRSYKDLSNSRGFKLVTYPFSDHFKKISKEQGIDWNNGWDSKYYQEIDLKKNPDCPVCSKKHNVKNDKNNGKFILPKALKDKGKIKYYNINENKNNKTIALYLDNGKDLFLSILGVLRAGMGYVLINNNWDNNQVFRIIEKAEARIIIANDTTIDIANSIKNNVNKNIVVININNLDKENIELEDLNINISRNSVAFYEYFEDDSKNLISKQVAHSELISGYPDIFNGQQDIYNAIIHGNPFDFEEYSGISGSNRTVTNLRNYLASELPDYMIPSFFIELEELPLLPNGKINRKALPLPEVQKTAHYIPPRNEVENKLVEIWAKVLKIEKGGISIDSNFFDLGGHSLKATGIISMIHQQFNKKLTILDIYKAGTIIELCNLLSKQKENVFELIKPAAIKEYYPISQLQQRLYIMQSREPDFISYNMPWIYNLKGNLNIDKIEKALNNLIKRHESFRTAFELNNGIPMQKVCNDIIAKLEYYEVNGNYVDQLINNFVRPFDLAKPPLLRMGIIKINEVDHILMIDMHHIISDGLSQKLFIRDFISIYQNEKLPELRVQYKDYIEWKNSTEIQDSLRYQENFWLEKLKEEVPVLNLPVDFKRPAIKSNEGSRIDFVIEEKQTAMLNELSKTKSTTLFNVLLAAFNILLSKLSGQEDIIIGTSVEGRKHVDLENIIGIFINILPLRNNPAAKKSFSDFLKEVNKNSIEAFNNQDYQIDDIIDKLNVQVNKNRNPIFDIAFVLHNMEVRSKEKGIADIKEFEIYPYDYKRITSKFDLTLFCYEYKGKLYLTFEYCNKLFTKNRLQQFIYYFKIIINTIVENPNIIIQDIDIIKKESTIKEFENIEESPLIEFRLSI